MANSDMGTEHLPESVIKSHAEAWIYKRGIKPPKEPSLSSDTTELAQEAYDLFLDRQDLRAEMVRGSANTSGETGLVKGRTLEERIRLIQSGNASSVLASFDVKNSAATAVQKGARVAEIEQRLDDIFSRPGVYERYQQGYYSQINARKGAREAKTLDEVVGQVNLQVARLTRQAEVNNRSLTLSERQTVQESLALIAPIDQKKRELLQDPDIFDQVRILELREYKRQLAKDRFAETPSRLHYMGELEKLWAQNKKVLVTGPTGTGKTELVRHTSRKMFNLSPFEITGHREMTPFELLGRTGLDIKKGEGGDVYRPSKLVQAMVASDGLGGAFLYDEMDASPNEANIALKTILNDGPGDTISIQMDSDQRHVIGHNYSFTGTANVRSEKHLSRFEIDPAIVRVLEPMIVNYMPPSEVWDIAIASLMDKRGGIPISQEDALTTLKDLCDAAYWTQQAYLGEKVQTGSGQNDFLKARAGASTGKPATLREAILDPGKLRGMLKGWEASRMKGMGLREHFDEQLVRFINNENYPPEDRYHLLEIFALKGFFRGREVSEFKVSDLDQRTLISWLGRNRERTKGREEYLRPERVAQLDPYGVLKRPISEEAELLLEPTDEESERVLPNVDFEWAKDLFGDGFYGPEIVEKTWHVTLSPDQIPDISDFFTQEQLERAKELNQRLILRIDRAKDGSPLTMRKMVEEKQDEFTKDGKGNILYQFNKQRSDPWYKDEPIFTREAPKVKWALISNGVLPNSTSKNYLEQTELLVNYLQSTVFAGQQIPPEYQDAIEEFGRERPQIAGLMKEATWNQAADRLAALKINQLSRHTPSEVVYDMIMVADNSDKRYLPDRWTWTSKQSRDGDLVRVGYSAAGGARVYYDRPHFSGGSLGVALSR